MVRIHHRPCGPRPERGSVVVGLVLAATIAVLLTASPVHAQGVGLQKVGTFAAPTYVTAPPGDPTRLVVVERKGRVRMVRRGRTLRRPFLDLRRDTLVKDRSGTGDQRGMLSLAFAPDYRRTGRVVVFYVDRRDRIRVDELRRSPANPDRVDGATRRPLLTIDDAGPLHHGGQLAFGPDGLLYVGIGFGDDERTAQDPASLRGKVLRLDLAQPAPRPEIHALGLRNPYRFAFDPPTGDLLIADVGGDEEEEMTRLPRGTPAGANLGWPAYEGNERLQAAAQPATPPIPPTLTRRHGPDWCSIVGGHVVRDRRLPALRGRYVFGDVCNGTVHHVSPRGGRSTRLRLRVPYLVSFGQDAERRLYAVSLAGGVWRLVPHRQAG